MDMRIVHSLPSRELSTTVSVTRARSKLYFSQDIFEIILIGTFSAIFSLGRLYVTNNNFLTSKVWAEDGLFALCIRQNGFAECTVEPFAGYLLFIPRTLAQFVAWTPFELWSYSTNIIASIFIAGCSALIYLVLRGNGIHRSFAILAALLPTLFPLAGFEAINVYASAYIPFLFLITLAVSLPYGYTHPYWLGSGLLLVALTIPTAILLTIPIVVYFLLKKIPLKSFLLALSFLLVGMMVQISVMATAEEKRSLTVTNEAFINWLGNIPAALYSLVPYLPLEAKNWGDFSTPNQTLAGSIIVITIVAVGIFLIFQGAKQDILLPIGLLLIVGILLSLIPAVTGHASNRYYILPLLLWTVAGLIFLNQYANLLPRWVPWLLTGVIMVSWVPAFPASQFRAQTAPDWDAQFSIIQQECLFEPLKNMEVKFSPDWPQPSAENPSGNISTTIACYKLY